MSAENPGARPAPEAWQRPSLRHATAQDAPSLAELVAALDGAAQASFKASAGALKAAAETRSLAVSLHRLSALAQAWEDEAGAQPPTLPGDAYGGALRLAARQLREAVAKGVPE